MSWILAREKQQKKHKAAIRITLINMMIITILITTIRILIIKNTGIPGSLRGSPRGARQIFGALDLDRSGFISMSEVDAPLAEMMTSLAVTIWSVFGTVETLGGLDERPPFLYLFFCLFSPPFFSPP